MIIVETIETLAAVSTQYEIYELRLDIIIRQYSAMVVIIKGPFSCDVRDIRRPFFKNKNQKNPRKNYKLTFNVISLEN